MDVHHISEFAERGMFTHQGRDFLNDIGKASRPHLWSGRTRHHVNGQSHPLERHCLRSLSSGPQSLIKKVHGVGVYVHVGFLKYLEEGFVFFEDVKHFLQFLHRRETIAEICDGV